MKISRGFTLWEIIIVTAIVAVLTSLAIPGISKYTQQKRSDVIAIQLQDTFKFVRTEALRRNLPITICGASFRSDNEALRGCADANNGWTGGMLAFVDVAKTGIYDGNAEYDGGKVRLVKFEKSRLIPATVTATSRTFVVNPDSTINEIKDNKLNSERTVFCFSIAQNLDGANKDPSITKFKINKYGSSTTCKVGIDNNCTAPNADPECK
jgi:prepilin-type N-terminal cleavage/methylation domain-containing protein